MGMPEEESNRATPFTNAPHKHDDVATPSSDRSIAEKEVSAHGPHSAIDEKEGHHNVANDATLAPATHEEPPQRSKLKIGLIMTCKCTRMKFALYTH
jgi:hypothetical protein